MMIGAKVARRAHAGGWSGITSALLIGLRDVPNTGRLTQHQGLDEDLIIQESRGVPAMIYITYLIPQRTMFRYL